MDVNDIRLARSSDGQNKDAHKKSLLKNVDDAKDKFDSIEIEHTPIRLMDRVRSRQNAPRHTPVAPDITDADQD